MAPVRSKKRASGTPPAMTGQRIPTKTGTPSKTPHNRSPIKKRKNGISLAQKQAIIDNLQLEITERARRLRAQYNQQAQGLRSRIEIRVNRIPMSLRKLTMGDLLQKYTEQQQKPALASRPPPVPAKDVPRTSPQKPLHVPIYLQHVPGRGHKRLSNDELAGPDKENERSIENPKKRLRGAPAIGYEPAQVLSPTTSNSRLAPRERPASPAKSHIARPASPAKPATSRGAGAANMLSNMVEKAKATRAGAGRKATTTSTTSSSSAGTSAPSTTRTKRGAATTTRAPATTRTTRRVSGVSNSSNDSNSTVVKKTTNRGAPATTQKRTVMGTLKKGVSGGTTTKRAAAVKSAAPATTTRVLRKRT